MRNNVNNVPVFGYIPTFVDGSVIACTVDQFPVKDKTLFKDNGFPRTDIGIVDRMSTLNMDKDLIEHVSSRMMDLSAESPYKGMTDKEMLAVLRPAFVQTATEYKQYSEMVYQFIREKSESLKKTEEVTTTETLESKEVATESVSESN